MWQNILMKDMTVAIVNVISKVEFLARVPGSILSATRFSEK
jgi:hypothetical protein